MDKKCDFCKIEFDEEMTVNVCPECGGSFCSKCCEPDLKEICPICGSDTVSQEEINEPDNLDEKVKDLKGYK